MTRFLPVRGTTTQINNTPITDGQILFETNQPNGQNHIYMDVGSQRIGVGIYDWSQITNKLFESIGSGLTVTSGVLSADDQDWSQILNKPFESINSDDFVVEDDTLLINPSVKEWANITDKPFETLGDGLNVDVDDVLNADIYNVTVSLQGSATASTSRYQQITINTTSTEINGTKYMEYEQTLDTTNDNVYTFNNADITTSSAIDVFTSISGMNPTDVEVTTGTCTVTFDPYTREDVDMVCRIYIK